MPPWRQRSRRHRRRTCIPSPIPAPRRRPPETHDAKATRMIPSRVHAVTDAVFPALIAALSRRRGPATRRIRLAGPIWHFAHTVLTRYEGGLVPTLSMRSHLASDAVGALSFVGAAALLQDEPPRGPNAARSPRARRTRFDRPERPGDPGHGVGTLTPMPSSTARHRDASPSSTRPVGRPRWWCLR